MINPTYPGVYVREESSGARAVAGVATSITSFVGMTQRGLLNKPQRIFGLRDYERLYGDGSAGGEMFEQVKLYFDNGGGEAWVTRIADGAVKASVTLKDERNTDSLTITAREPGDDGNKVRVEVDYNTAKPESTFNMTVFRRYLNADGSEDIRDVEVHSELTMNPDAGNFVETVINNMSQMIEVDVDAAAAAYTNSKAYSGLVVPNDGPSFGTLLTVLFPTSTGSLSISVNNSAAMTVNFVFTDETDFEDNLRVAINAELAAAVMTETVTVSGTAIGDATSDGRLLLIQMANGSFTLSSSGAADDIVKPLMLTPAYGGIYIDHYARSRPAPTGFSSRIGGSAADSTIARLQNFVEETKTDINEFTLTDTSDESPHNKSSITFTGAGADFLTGTVYTPVSTEPGALTNVSEHLNKLAAEITGNTQSHWEAEVHGYRIVLKPLFGDSNAEHTADFVTATSNLGAGVSQIFNIDANVKSYSLGETNGLPGQGNYQVNAAPGDDGKVPQESDYRTAFDNISREVDLFNLMVLPRAEDKTTRQTDSGRKSAFNAASAFCSDQRAFLLVDPPSDVGSDNWSTAGAAGIGSDNVRIGMETRNSAVFWPRLKNSSGAYQDPSGPMAGVMARTDGRRGVWKAAAGVEATIRGVTGVEHRMNDDDNGIINPKAVNALRVFPDGILSWGARTLVGFNDSGNIDDKYIPVRRTMLFIEESLYRGLRFAVFEPNDEPLWAQIRLAAGSFMNTLFRQGAFAGQKASDAYFVLCDSTTTTETDKNLGIVNVVVGFAPLKPAEFVILTVKQIAGQVQT